MSSPKEDCVTTLCRICLQPSEESASIYDHDSTDSQMAIFEKIEQCGGIKIVPDPELPTRICNKCCAFLTIAYKFRTICRNSNYYLSRFVSKTAPIYVSNNENTYVEGEDVAGIEEEANSESAEFLNESTCTDPNLSAVIIDGDSVVEYEQITEYQETWLPTEQDNSSSAIQGDEHVILDDDDCIGDDYDIKLSPTKTLEISSDGAAVIRMKGTNRIKKEASTSHSKEKLPHVCDFCGNTYPRKYALEAHIRRHRNERPFKCEICGKDFHLNFQLTRHMRKHTGARPYQCRYCQRSFADRSTMTKHERIHRNERPYSCTTCGKNFTYSSVLKVHQLTHTGEKAFSCGICNKRFARSHHLRAHLETQLHQSDPRSKELLRQIKREEDRNQVDTATLC